MIISESFDEADEKNLPRKEGEISIGEDPSVDPPRIVPAMPSDHYHGCALRHSDHPALASRNQLIHNIENVAERLEGPNIRVLEVKQGGLICDCIANAGVSEC